MSDGKTMYKWTTDSAAMGRVCTVCTVTFRFLRGDFCFVVVLFSNPETLNLPLQKTNVKRVKAGLMIVF